MAAGEHPLEHLPCSQLPSHLIELHRLDELTVDSTQSGLDVGSDELKEKLVQILVQLLVLLSNALQYLRLLFKSTETFALGRQVAVFDVESEIENSTH